MNSKLALAGAFVCAALCHASAVTPSDYAKEFIVTVSEAVGDKTAENAVVPIRLSSAIGNFSYADFNESDGTDMLITDDAGNALSYEIDKWDTGGMTAVWVKVPNIAAGTRIHVYFSGAANTVNDPTDVWSRFLGVWHFNETSVNGTSADAYDASGNNLTGYDTPRTTSVDGLFGLARQPRATNYDNHGVGGVFLPAMTLGGKFAISGCFNVANCGFPTFFSTIENPGDLGFHYFIRSTWSMANFELLGDGMTDGWNSASTGSGIGTSQWNSYCFVTDKDSAESRNFWLYVNGVKTGTGKNVKGTVSDNGKEIAVGNLSCDAAKADAGPGCSWSNGGGAGAGRSFCGQMDEIRIQSFADFDADREYFEGATMKDASLLVYSPVATASDPSSLFVTFSADALEGVAPFSVEFTAETTYAVGDCTYSWDFDNDGEYDLVSSSAVVTNIYTERGLYTVALNVTDSGAGDADSIRENYINVLTALTVDCVPFSATVDLGLPIEFTAIVGNAHEGACTYDWDFDGDGLLDDTTTVPTASWVYTTRGMQTVTVTVTDSAGDVKSVTKPNIVEVTVPGVVGGNIYVDFGAVDGGVGSEASPYNTLFAALDVATDDNTIYMKGLFDIGALTATLSINVPGLVLTKWGDDKPIFSSLSMTKDCPNELISLAAAGIVLSDIDFEVTRETVGASKPLVAVNATGCTITRCDFAFTNARINANGTCGTMGIIGVGDTAKSSNNIDLTVSKCSFKNIEVYMNQNSGVIFVVDGTKILENRFDTCSRIIGKKSDNWGAPLQIVSNVVINSTATDATGNGAGALLRGGWTYYCQSGSEIAYNIFVNENNDGGCIIEVPSKTFQKGIRIHHNTVRGFAHFLSDVYATADWTAQIYDNLFIGSGALYEFSNLTPSGHGKEGTQRLNNNVCTHEAIHGPDGSDTSMLTIENNFEDYAVPKFVSRDPESDSYAQPKVYTLRDPLLAGGWADSYSCPTYIGALPPLYVQQGTFMLFN